ncbi:phosphoribosyl-ATP diphosphatase [Kiloniella laminariae]|uniref:Phosphoribosyl-ATP pyrophosphatase n=1 Tax=Kiloniella laminariae TaxID=454162 RepID=A0ABT4LJG1_9PROT|nr:phosphoribosyl-ATP diphosphatase [Kiloniella laminariae]MCZ4281211.1 phosphoribosyl-ATP diphosphatase [Kiloniella laminariae]
MSEELDEDISAALLDELYKVVLSRKGDDPAQSHTANLFAKGIHKISQKVGEEAVEVVIEAVSGPREGVISESADLLYHLMVLWAERGIKPAEVWTALEGRKGISGIAEKASRKVK